jgi:hypothetical protein
VGKKEGRASRRSPEKQKKSHLQITAVVKKEATTDLIWYQMAEKEIPTCIPSCINCQQGKEVHAVGKWNASLVKTAWGSVTVAFQQRTQSPLFFFFNSYSHF